MPIVVDERTDEELHQVILTRHQELCSALVRFVAEIAEHDRREAYRHYGARSEVDYLKATLDVAFTSALAWVRAGHALPRLPDLAAEFAEGAVSFDKVKALVELVRTEQPQVVWPAGPFDDPADMPAIPEPDGHADPAPDPDPSDQPGTDGGGSDGGGSDGAGAADDGVDLMDLARSMSAADLAAEARRRAKVSTDQAHAAHRRRHVQIHAREEGRRLDLDGSLFDDGAAIVRAALDEYANNCGADADGTFRSRAERYADALVAIASSYMADREKAANRPGLFVHVDARVLAGEDGWAEATGYSPLAAETARRLACAARVVVVADDHEGNTLYMGRTSYRPSWQLEQVVRRRDGGCTFVGCEAIYGTEVHHIIPWDPRGPTDIDNLAVQCKYHHHLLHEGGWKLKRLSDGALQFTSPDGKVFVQPARDRSTPRRAASAHQPPQAEQGALAFA